MMSGREKSVQSHEKDSLYLSTLYLESFLLFTFNGGRVPGFQLKGTQSYSMKGILLHRGFGKGKSALKNCLNLVESPLKWGLNMRFLEIPYSKGN